MSSKTTYINAEGTEFQLSHEDGDPAISVKSSELVHLTSIPELQKLTTTVTLVDDMSTLTDMQTDDICFVTDKSRGGHFSYDETQSTVNNHGTIFNGWVRQYVGNLNLKWFGAVGDKIVTDNDAFGYAALAAVAASNDALRYPAVIVPVGQYRLTADTPSATWILEAGSEIHPMVDTGIGTIQNLRRLIGTIIQTDGVEHKSTFYIGDSNLTVAKDYGKDYGNAELSANSNSGSAGVRGTSFTNGEGLWSAGCIGLHGVVVNEADNLVDPNRPRPGQVAWAQYLEAALLAEVDGGSIFGQEITLSVETGNTSGDLGSYNLDSRAAVSTWYKAGGPGTQNFSSENISCHILFFGPDVPEDPDQSVQAKKGIIVMDNSIATGIVMEIPTGYYFSWKRSETSNINAYVSDTRHRLVSENDGDAVSGILEFIKGGDNNGVGTPTDSIPGYTLGRIQFNGIRGNIDETVAFMKVGQHSEWDIEPSVRKATAFVKTVVYDGTEVTAEIVGSDPVEYEIGKEYGTILTGSYLNDDPAPIRIKGSFRPIGDDNLTLGTVTSRWIEIYASNGTINISDERKKTELLDITATEKLIALEIKPLIKKFQFIDDGVNGKIHFGVGAQTVKSIFESHGLVAEDYNVLTYDSWEDNTVDGVFTPAGDMYGIRYSELAMFILAAI